MKEILASLIIIIALSSCCPAMLVNGSGPTAYNNATLVSGELQYKPSSNWQAEPPTNPMRYQQYKISDSAELAVFRFPGGVGGVEDNFSRWQKQFKSDVKLLDKKQFNINNLPVSIQYLRGTYMESSAPMMPDAPKTEKANYASYSVLVEMQDEIWVFKAVGAAADIAKALPEIQSMIESFSY